MAEHVSQSSAFAAPNEGFVLINGILVTAEAAVRIYEYQKRAREKRASSASPSPSTVPAEKSVPAGAPEAAPTSSNVSDGKELKKLHDYYQQTEEDACHMRMQPTTAWRCEYCGMHCCGGISAGMCPVENIYPNHLYPQHFPEVQALSQRIIDGEFPSIPPWIIKCYRERAALPDGASGKIILPK
jgi:hypothetical protein